ncbi:MAG: hypothetical protein KAR33_05130 [Candidatus Thorarchaeota archaeon]|nr:hypothetical protein [Candidatus Thorarchaeota archaeon]
MKVVYKNYEPDQGLDELQAKIYTEASGLPATAEEIKARNITRPSEMTRYALTEDDTPLAYVTSRDSSSEPGRTYIGYPWKLKDCPDEAQKAIFTDVMKFLKGREETKTIGTTVVVGSKIADQQLKFFHKLGFREEDQIYIYNKDLNVKKVSKWDLGDKESSYDARGITIEDIDDMIELIQSDPYIKNAFPNKDAIREYLENRVLKDGHAVAVFKDKKFIAASAVLRATPDSPIISGDEDRYIMRFSAMRPGYKGAWKRLVVEIAKECVAANLVDVPLLLRTTFTSRDPVATGIAEIKPELELFEKVLVLENKE